MAISFVAKANNSSDATANSIANVYGGGVLAGSNQVTGFISWFNGTTGATSNLTSVTDDGGTGGSTYTIIDTVTIGGGLFAASFYTPLIHAGATTITAHFSDANPGFFRMFTQTYAGGYSLIGINAHNAQVQVGPATSTDAITSNTATTTLNGCMIVGCTICTTTATAMSVGTGFTQRDALVNGGDSDNQKIEDLLQTTAGSIAATFTAAAGTGGDTYATFMLAVQPPPAGSPAVIAWVGA
jgi:hypothetical protein